MVLVIKKICPTCGSCNTRRNGYYKNVVRGYCLTCGLSFYMTDKIKTAYMCVDISPYRRIFHDNISCPQCKSTHIRKNGKRDGVQYYLCTICGASFSREGYNFTKERKCIVCGIIKVLKIWRKDNEGEYICPTCKKDRALLLKKDLYDKQNPLPSDYSDKNRF